MILTEKTTLVLKEKYFQYFKFLTDSLAKSSQNIFAYTRPLKMQVFFYELPLKFTCLYWFIQLTNCFGFKFRI